MNHLTQCAAFFDRHWWSDSTGIYRLTILLCLMVLWSDPTTTCAQEPDWKDVERFGAPEMYTPSVTRYRYGTPNVNHTRFYPISQEPITRDTYMEWMEESGLLKHVDNPQRGEGGLAELLPALAKYVQTGESKYADACIAMLNDCYRAMQEEVKSKGWCEHFGDPSGLMRKNSTGNFDCLNPSYTD